MAKVDINPTNKEYIRTFEGAGFSLVALGVFGLIKLAQLGPLFRFESMASQPFKPEVSALGVLVGGLTLAVGGIIADVKDLH
jgi:hypothetical protein